MRFKKIVLLIIFAVILLFNIKLLSNDLFWSAGSSIVTAVGIIVAVKSSDKATKVSNAQFLYEKREKAVLLAENATILSNIMDQRWNDLLNSNKYLTIVDYMNDVIRDCQEFYKSAPFLDYESDSNSEGKEHADIATREIIRSIDRIFEEDLAKKMKGIISTANEFVKFNITGYRFSNLQLDAVMMKGPLVSNGEIIEFVLSKSFKELENITDTPGREPIETLIAFKKYMGHRSALKKAAIEYNNGSHKKALSLLTMIAK